MVDVIDTVCECARYITPCSARWLWLLGLTSAGCGPVPTDHQAPTSEATVTKATATKATATKATANISFTASRLHSEFMSEGAAFADFDRDGDQNIVAGPYRYEGPNFVQRHALYPAVDFDPKGYSDNFFAFAHDFNHDDWPDVLVVGFPGQAAIWLENPTTKRGPWVRHPVFSAVDTESPALLDLTGDGTPELVSAAHGQLGWFAPDASSPADPWVFHPLSPNLGFLAFTTHPELSTNNRVSAPKLWRGT